MSVRQDDKFHSMASEDSKCCGPCRGGCCGRFFQRGRELESIDTNHSYTEEERRDLAKFHSIDYMPCTCAGAFQPSMLPLPTYPVSRHTCFDPKRIRSARSKGFTREE